MLCDDKIFCFSKKNRFSFTVYLIIPTISLTVIKLCIPWIIVLKNNFTKICKGCTKPTILS